MDTDAAEPAKSSGVCRGVPQYQPAGVMGQKKKRGEIFVKMNTTRIRQLQREIALVLTICPDPRKIFHIRGYLQYELVLLK